MLAIILVATYATVGILVILANCDRESRRKRWLAY